MGAWLDTTCFNLIRARSCCRQLLDGNHPRCCVFRRATWAARARRHLANCFLRRHRRNASARVMTHLHPASARGQPHDDDQNGERFGPWLLQHVWTGGWGWLARAGCNAGARRTSFAQAKPTLDALRTLRRARRACEAQRRQPRLAKWPPTPQPRPCEPRGGARPQKARCCRCRRRRAQ